MDQATLIKDAFQGRYEASRQIGEGGFGQVFEARQLATGQLVAIKILRLKQNKQIETQIARFKREMRLCAGLHHPNIVRLIDSGQLTDDVLCTVFEFVPGVTLAEVLKSGGLEPRQATHLMMQVLDALGCAHATGIVHRDLKPQNIMITDTGVRRNAMVLDFGIGAIVEAAQLEELARLTKTNELLGTPAYAAPEQLRGQPPSIRSDLYSWGLVFLECLTGEQAIKADNLAELLARQSGPEPVPIPSWLRSHQLGRILSRVLAKEVDRRLVDATELMRELERREIAGSNLEALASHRTTTSSQNLEVLDANTGNQTLLESFDMERHVLAGERRQVTAVCCTLEFGAEDKDLDLRTYLGLFQAQQRLWSEVLERHDGYFAGSVGDRFLFYFGYPLAREDDALRATRCALAMLEVTTAHASALESEHGIGVSLGIGIHTDVVVTQMMSSSTIYSDVVGMTPVVAERIEAPGGSVVVSAATRRILRERFEFEAAGALECGELAAPIQLHRVVRERADIGDIDHEFVGRSHELSLLEHRWGLATQGTGQTVLITAEAGVGKSRLARELHRRLPGDGHRYLVCRCSPESRNSALQPVIELLEHQLLARLGEATIDGTPSDGQRANALDEFLHALEYEGDGDDNTFSLLASLLGIALDPQRYPPLTLTPDRQRELTIAAVVGVILELSEALPLLFVVEDVHWADPSTLTLLEQLFEEVQASECCVIATARPEFEPPTTLEFMTRVQLTSLGNDEVVELLDKLTGGARLPPAIVNQIRDRADGIPLFVEELTQVLLANLPEDGDAPSTSNFEIPTSLREALTARIDRLGPAKTTCHVASALGREFSANLLEEVASEFVEGDVAAHVDALCSAGLVTRRRRRGTVHYTFKHALVREVAHAAMLPDDRASVHARTALALERKFPKVVSKRPDLLAMHHHEAGQTSQAIAYAQTAATTAMLRSAMTEAAAHATEALQWLPGLDDRRARAEAELDLNGILTRVVMLTQGYGVIDVEKIARRSEELIAELGGSSQHVFPNLAAFGLFHLVRGNMTAALDHADRLLMLAREAEDTSQEVYALSFTAQATFFVGQYARQREVSERALKLFDPVAHGGHLFQYGMDSKVNVEGHLCSTLSITGELDAGAEVAKRAHDRALALNIPHITYGTLFSLASMHHLRGDRDAVVAVSDEIRALAAVQGGSWYVMLIENQRAWAEGHRDVLEGLIGMLKTFDTAFARGYWAAMAAELAVDAGDYDGGLQHIEWAMSHLDDGSRLMVPELHRIRANLLTGKGPDFREAAIASIRAALAMAREQGAKLFELRSAIEYTRITTGLDEYTQALDTLTEAYGNMVEGQEHHELVTARSILSGVA